MRLSPTGLLVAAVFGLTLGTTAAPTLSSAQDDVRERGNRACGAVVRRMCKGSFEGGDMAILGCLQQNKSKLSGGCRKFLTDVGQLN